MWQATQVDLFTSRLICTSPAQVELGKAGAAEMGKELMGSRACEEFHSVILLTMHGVGCAASALGLS
jgi:hypothetical protein